MKDRQLPRADVVHADHVFQHDLDVNTRTAKPLVRQGLSKTLGNITRQERVR